MQEAEGLDRWLGSGDQARGWLGSARGWMEILGIMPGVVG